MPPHTPRISRCQEEELARGSGIQGHEEGKTGSILIPWGWCPRAALHDYAVLNIPSNPPPWKILNLIPIIGHCFEQSASSRKSDVRNMITKHPTKYLKIWRYRNLEAWCKSFWTTPWIIPYDNPYTDLEHTKQVPSKTGIRKERSGVGRRVRAFLDQVS